MVAENRAPVQVLNLGSNKLSGRLTITGLPALRALMLNDNQLTGVDGEQTSHCCQLHMAASCCIIHFNCNHDSPISMRCNCSRDSSVVMCADLLHRVVAHPSL